MKLTFDLRLPDFEEVSDRGHARSHKAAGTAVADWFIKERVQKRFDGSMKGELMWAPRDERYERNKQRRGFGAGKPHFYTGATASKFKKATPRVSKRFVGIRVAGLGPQYNRFDANFSKKKGGRQVMKLRQEIARLSDAEGARAAEIYASVYVAAMQDELMKARQQVTIR